jgi:hypothetical protein
MLLRVVSYHFYLENPHVFIRFYAISAIRKGQSSNSGERVRNVYAMHTFF